MRDADSDGVGDGTGGDDTGDVAGCEVPVDRAESVVHEPQTMEMSSSVAVKKFSAVPVKSPLRAWGIRRQPQ